MAQSNSRRTNICSIKRQQESSDASLLQAEDIRRIREGKNQLSLEEQKRFIERARISRTWRQLAIF